MRALAFLIHIWDMVPNVESIMTVCDKLRMGVTFDVPFSSKLRWDEKTFRGSLAEIRRLGLLPSVATALASDQQVNPAKLCLYLIAEDIRGWGRNKPPIPNKYRDVGVELDVFSNRISRLYQGRYDNTHPLRETEINHPLWGPLCMLTRSAGQAVSGDQYYRQLLGYRTELIDKGLFPAVIQNFHESIVGPEDPLRCDPTCLHETVRFSSLYATFRLAYPGLGRTTTEELLEYPNPDYPNHWSIPVVIDRFEQDWNDFALPR